MSHRKSTRTATAAVVLLAIVFAWAVGGHGLPWAGADDLHLVDSGKFSSREGYVPTPLSPSSDQPAVARLDPALHDALRQAASDAGAEGVTLLVNGGWRSARYQRQLLQGAVKKYGSVEVARQYVLPPAKSKHVSGEAVDVFPAEADSWLAERGSAYGLCQIYANEPWHFELATEPGGLCPPLISSAAAG